jgi:uncharacterized protein YfbU (UPF0304 family)
METIMYPREVKARKNHRCNFCNYDISKNEIYIKSTHVLFDDIYDWKTHKKCYEIADILKMYDECNEGVTMRNFQEAIIEEYNKLIPFSPKCDYKEKLMYVINHYKNLKACQKKKSNKTG